MHENLGQIAILILLMLCVMFVFTIDKRVIVDIVCDVLNWWCDDVKVIVVKRNRKSRCRCKKTVVQTCEKHKG